MVCIDPTDAHHRHRDAFPSRTRIAILAGAMTSLMFGKRATGILFGDGQEHLRPPNSKNGWFAVAVRRSQTLDRDFPQLTPHDLRRTAASLAISAGANVKAVQRMLGHASAAMTLDTYADLFDEDLDHVAGALSKARSSDMLEAPPNIAPPAFQGPEAPAHGRDLQCATNAHAGAGKLRARRT